MPKTRHSISNQRRGFSDIIEWSIVKNWIPKSSKFDQTTVFKVQNRQISSKSQNLPLGQLIDPDGAHLPLVGIFTALDWHQLKKNSRNFQVKCYMRGKIWVYELILDVFWAKLAAKRKIWICQNFGFWFRNSNIFSNQNFRNSFFLFLPNIALRNKNSNSAPSTWSNSKVSAQIDFFFNLIKMFILCKVFLRSSTTWTIAWRIRKWPSCAVISPLCFPLLGSHLHPRRSVEALDKILRFSSILLPSIATLSDFDFFVSNY